MTAIYQFGRFELRTTTRQLLVDREPVPLGARAFDVLLALIERRDRVITKNELLDLVWPGLVVEENNLQVQISDLRRILGQDAIATIPGRGYRFTVALADGGALGVSGDNLPQAAHPTKTLLAPIDEGAPSIAMLPFVNMSDDQANEYFADGIAEELLNVLSKIRDVRVASHTSAFGFKGSKADVATVAQRLACRRYSREVSESPASAFESASNSSRWPPTRICGRGRTTASSRTSAHANAYCGNVDIAFEWLERAYVQRNAGLPHVQSEPLLRNLHGDPRWQPFLKKMGLAEHE